MITTEKDRRGLARLLDQIRDSDAKGFAIRCFNREEAVWIRRHLEAAGVESDRLVFSWLEWPPNQSDREE